MYVIYREDQNLEFKLKFWCKQNLCYLMLVKQILLNNGYEIEPNRCFKFVHTTSLSMSKNHKFEWLIRPYNYQW